jgi:hypothetical protein
MAPDGTSAHWRVTTSGEVRHALRDIRRTNPSIHRQAVRTLRVLSPWSGEPVDEWGDLRRVVQPETVAEFFVMPGGRGVHVVRLVCLLQPQDAGDGAKRDASRSL